MAVKVASDGSQSMYGLKILLTGLLLKWMWERRKERSQGGSQVFGLSSWKVNDASDSDLEDFGDIRIWGRQLGTEFCLCSI